MSRLPHRATASRLLRRPLALVAAGILGCAGIGLAVPGLSAAATAQHHGLVRDVSARLPITRPHQTVESALRPAGLSPTSVTPPGKPLDTWSTLATLSGAVIHDVSFPTAKVGYAAGENGQVWKTTDGGEDWSLVLNRGFPYYYYGVDAVKKNVVVVSGFNDQSGAGILTWSDDGGQTWQPDQTLSASAWAGRVRVTKSDALAMNGMGASGGEPNVAWYSNDGGQTWTQDVPDPSGGWFGYQFTLLRSQRAYASGITYCASTDTGATWACRQSIDSVFDGPTEFVNKRFGWVGGGEISPNVDGWVHRTTDGGQTWSGRVLDTPWPVRQIEFLNAKVGWAAGGNVYTGVGGMYVTTDGGKTWTLDDDTGTEVGACAHHTVGSGAKTRVWCIGFGQSGSFFSTVYRTTVPTPGH